MKPCERQIREKMRRGEYQSADMPYGYQKSADGRMSRIRKPLRLSVRCFLWAADGNTVAEIVQEGCDAAQLCSTRRVQSGQRKTYP